MPREEKLDSVDHALIREMRKDARARIVYLSKKTNIPTSTVFDKIRKLRRHGVLFTTVINWQAIGCSLTVCLVAPYDEKIVKLSCVNSCQRVSPDSLMVECVFSSFLELESFLKEVPQAKTYPVVEVLKKEGFVP